MSSVHCLICVVDSKTVADTHLGYEGIRAGGLTDCADLAAQMLAQEGSDARLHVDPVF